MIATGIITAPRPKPTLFESIVSYRVGGFTNRVHVFAEKDVGFSSANMITEVNKERLGNLRNWAKALTTLFTDTKAPWLMICEDDIVWAQACAETLFSDLQSYRQRPDYHQSGAISLFCPIKASKEIEQRNGVLQRGWYGSSQGKKTWGAQCLVFSREQARELLSCRIFNGFLNDYRWDKNIDAIIGQSLAARQKNIAYRIPCLVNHTLGEGNSSLGYSADRPNLLTKYWTGRP